MVTGDPGGAFRPDAIVTRAELVVMFMNTVKEGSTGTEPSFTDSNEIGNWAKFAIAQAISQRFIQGYPDGSFRPKAQVTRAEMALLAARTLGLERSGQSGTTFKDDRDIPNWAREAVGLLQDMSIVQGDLNNQYQAAAMVTRAELVTLLIRLYPLLHPNEQ